MYSVCTTPWMLIIKINQYHPLPKKTQTAKVLKHTESRNSELGSHDCCSLFSFECQKAISMASQWDVHGARPFGLARNATKVW